MDHYPYPEVPEPGQHPEAGQYQVIANREIDLLTELNKRRPKVKMGELFQEWCFS